jgi:hypothetical protein
LQDDDIIAESLDILIEVVDANFVLFNGGVVNLGLPLHQIAIDLCQSLLGGLLLA